ncbi:MAG: hypothetical protein H6Q53_1905 [Deltaproteobacteria bacterium]|nr:hypothetical protein [Deltaproteobacteria bacterium]
MKKIVFILLVIAGICYYYNPPFEDHISLLSSQAPEKMSTEGNVEVKIQGNLDFINLYVASATKDKQRLSIVTFGVFKKVILIDKEWLEWVSKGRP